MTFDLVTVLVILTLGLITPGPDMLLVVKNSLAGPARGRATVAGIALGLALQTSVLAASFTALSVHAARIVELLRWGGAAVLVWIGWRALLARGGADGPDQPAGGRSAAPAHGAFVEGLLCNLGNPKAFLFFAGLFSQLLGPGSPGWLGFGLPALVTVHGFGCWFTLSWLVQSGPVAGWLGRWRAPLERAFGLLLVLFGLGLLWWRR